MQLARLSTDGSRPRSYLIAAALRDAIYRGQLPSGEPLHQSALADQLGVSPIPLREALKQLESEGLVTFNGHRGAVVTGLSATESRDIYEMITWLETGLLNLAFNRLSPEDLRLLPQLLDRMERENDPVLWKEMNAEFHTTLYAAADRPLILDQLAVLRRQVDRYIRCHLEMMREESQQDHRLILRALCAHQREDALAHLHRHLAVTSARLQDLMSR